VITDDQVPVIEFLASPATHGAIDAAASPAMMRQTVTAILDDPRLGSVDASRGYDARDGAPVAGGTQPNDSPRI
jgi:hypothetical protein